MCGIAGIYGQHNHHDIQDMMLEIKHRGYDSNGFFSNEKVALGHQRLAILDLSENGNQPMTNSDKTIYLAVNGEIYNYQELRKILIHQCHTFKSQCDSEVLIHAYEECGEDFIYSLRGMFALAIYDLKEDKLILARDPIGKKPLYYYQDGKRIVFASEIKALFKAGVPCKVNYNVIPSFLMYQYTVGTDTLFEGIKKLPAGHMLITDLHSFKLKQYWQIKDAVYQSNETYALKYTKELLEQSVKLRLQSDVPVGSFLSGGIDSSAVTALYRKYYSGDLHTFTASFETKSESQYAKIVSQHLNTIYHEIMITPEMVVRDLKKITWHHDEPLGDAATINNYYLAQEAKKYVTVVLAGEGGDEVFGGYPWYKYANYISMFRKIPLPLRKLGEKLVGVGDITSRDFRFSRMVSFPMQNDIEMLLYPTTSINRQNVEWLLNYDGYKMQPTIPCQVNKPYNQMLAMDCLNKLPEQYLMKADKATMAWAIEERLPLLDKELIDYAFMISPELKKDKYILRKAVEDLLPQKIVWRKKQGFGTPLANWLSNYKLKQMVVDSLMYGGLINQICRHKSLTKLINYYFKNSFNQSKIMALNPLNVIWSLFALQVWYDVWFEDER